MSRTKNSLRNIKYGLVAQVITLLVSFFARIIFIKSLGIDYLGLNGVLTNLISLLSLAELGAGTAIVYSLYEPLEKNDNVKVRQLLILYKKIYYTISVIIFLIGIIFSINLDFFIKVEDSIEGLQLFFWIFVINTCLTYLLSYKRSLLIADQKKYIDTYYQSLFFLILNIIQIIFLMLTKDYAIFLAIKTITIIFENLLISRKIKNMYDLSLLGKDPKMDKIELKKIFKNISAMFLHKIGGILVLSTDNLLISKFINLSTVGVYSNYLLIINALKLVFIIIYQSLTASVGNLSVEANKNRIKELFEMIDFGSFWISSFFSVCLFNMFNPFISLWLGSKYLFDDSIVFSLVVIFYINSMRNSVLTFKDSLGLFWQDRYKPIFEAGLNLIFSIILVQKFGLIGIFLGTILSSVFTVIWIEPYVLFKFGFGDKPYKYFKTYVLRYLFTLIVGFFVWKLNSILYEKTLYGFIFTSLTTFGLFNISFALVYFRNNEFKLLINKLNEWRKLSL